MGLFSHAVDFVQSVLEAYESIIIKTGNNLHISASTLLEMNLIFWR